MATGSTLVDRMTTKKPVTILMRINFCSRTSSEAVSKLIEN
jgi:hypothetical protein